MKCVIWTTGCMTILPRHGQWCNCIHLVTPDFMGPAPGPGSHKWHMARRATSSIPTAESAVWDSLKEDFAPQNEIALWRKHCLTFSCLGGYKGQSRIISSPPFSSATDSVLLIYSLTAKHKPARVFEISCRVFPYTKCRARRKDPFPKPDFSHGISIYKHTCIFFCPFWKGAFSVSACFQRPLASQFCKTSGWPFQDLKSFISFPCKKKDTEKRDEKGRGERINSFF